MKSKFFLGAFVFLSFMLCVASLHSEPANILVDILTFTRPENWRWEEPPKTSKAESRFVPGPGDNIKTDVRFYIVNNKDVSSERASLLGQFPEASAADIHEESVKIEKHAITYFRVTGTYKYRDSKPKSDQLWVGAAIPTGKKHYVYVRIQGPRVETEQYVASFKKMVETAVREQEIN